MTKATQKKYLARITGTEKRGSRGQITLYYIGENFTVEALRCEPDLSNAHSLVNLWKKAGYIPEVLPSYISIDTFYRNADGCWGLYNITEKESDDGKRREINFNYLREATDENELELVAECIRLAVKAGAIK